MPITLAEAKVGMADHVDQKVIEIFQRSSFLLDALTFDDAISPGTGGSTLTYGYVQELTPSTAGVRTINREYTANEAKRTEKNTKAIIMGGAFEVDRVIQATSGAINELNYQLNDKIKATASEFHNLVVNGSSVSDDAGYKGGTFDGLRKLLSGTSNELNTTVDVSTGDKRTSAGHDFLDELDALIASILGGADMLLMNKKMLGVVRSIARRAGYHESKRDELGRVVETYNGIPMVDLGTYYDATTGKEVDVLANDTTSDSTSDSTTGSIIAVHFDLAKGLHGISPVGGADGLIHTYLPDLNAPGAVKKGEVELVAGMALKNSKAAGILKGIKI